MTPCHYAAFLFAAWSLTTLAAVHPRLLIAALMWLAVGAVTVALAWLVVLLGAAAGM